MVQLLPRGSRRYFACSLFLTLGGLAGRVSGTEDGLPGRFLAAGAVKLPVCVFNHAGVAQETLARAEEDASRILGDR